jgi:hypothetical protein
MHHMAGLPGGRGLEIVELLLERGGVKAVLARDAHGKRPADCVIKGKEEQGKEDEEEDDEAVGDVEALRGLFRVCASET